MTNVEKFYSHLEEIGLTPEQSLAVDTAANELVNSLHDDFGSKLESIRVAFDNQQSKGGA